MPVGENEAKEGKNEFSFGQNGTAEFTLSQSGVWKITYDSTLCSICVINPRLPVASGETFTVDGESATIYVSTAGENTSASFTLEKVGEVVKANEVENGGSLALGDNEVTTYEGENFDATVYLTPSDTLTAGDYTLVISSVWSGSVSVGGESKMDDGNGNLTVTVTLGTTPVAIALRQGGNGNAIITVSKAEATQA